MYHPPGDPARTKADRLMDLEKARAKTPVKSVVGGNPCNPEYERKEAKVVQELGGIVNGKCHDKGKEQTEERLINTLQSMHAMSEEEYGINSIMATRKLFVCTTCESVNDLTTVKQLRMYAEHGIEYIQGDLESAPPGTLVVIAHGAYVVRCAYCGAPLDTSITNSEPLEKVTVDGVARLVCATKVRRL